MQEQEPLYRIEDLLELARAGRVVDAMRLLEQAEALQIERHGEESFEVAALRGDFGQFCIIIGEPRRAVELLQQAVECEPGRDQERQKHLLTLGSVLAQALEKNGQPALAEEAHLENLKQRVDFYGEGHAGHGFGLAWYAEFLARKGDERALHVALDALRSLQPSTHPRMAEVLVLMARLQLKAGLEHPFSTIDLDEEIWDLVGQAMGSGLSDFSPEILLDAIDSYLRVDPRALGPRAPGRRAAHEIGFAIARNSKLVAAMHIHAEVLRAWSRADGDLRGEQWATMEMAFAADKLGNPAEAEALYKDGIRLANELGDDRTRCHALRQLGLFQAHLERPEAETTLRNALLEALILEDPTELARTRAALGIHLQHKGFLEEARGLLREALVVLPEDLSLRSHLDAIEREGSCGCGDPTRAVASALLELVRPELPEGLIEDVVLDEDQFCPRLSREPTEEEIALLQRAWTQALARLNLPPL